MNLRDALEHCSLGLLREIAERRGAPGAATTLRRELVERLAAALADAPATLATLERQPAAGRALLGRLLPDGLPGGQARRWLRSDHGLPPAAAETIIRDLVSAGLLFRVFRLDAGQRGEWLVVPGEIAVCLAAFVPAAPTPPAALAEPVTAHHSAEPALDLLTLLHALARAEGRPAADALAALPFSGPPEDDPRRALDRWRWL
ncbi:MAG: hypothetical protein IT304_13445, partial [Dehalococcoidia bacterium]|nr:hypothetical protein [Dehalococcoidia bacterium]